MNHGPPNDFDIDPKLIVREHHYLRVDDRGTTAVPALLLFGNAAGYRLLAAHFAGLAEIAAELSGRERGPHVDDMAAWDEHADLPTDGPPFTPDLSDVIHIRCGVLTRHNEEYVSGLFDLSTAPPKRADLADRFRALIKLAKESKDAMADCDDRPSD